jgi:hypothetical protein
VQSPTNMEFKDCMHLPRALEPRRLAINMLPMLRLPFKKGRYALK